MQRKFNLSLVLKKKLWKEKEKSLGEKQKKTLKRKMNKKADTLVLETVIFIVLNIIFIAGMFIFIYGVGSKTFVYEQSYAKQIAILIDNAKPRMAILLDVTNGISAAGKSKIPKEEMFIIDKQNNLVKVKLRKGGSYGYQYFSNYDVNLTLKDNWLLINIKPKEEIQK